MTRTKLFWFMWTWTELERNYFEHRSNTTTRTKLLFASTRHDDKTNVGSKHFRFDDEHTNSNAISLGSCEHEPHAAFILTFRKTLDPTFNCYSEISTDATTCPTAFIIPFTIYSAASKTPSTFTWQHYTPVWDFCNTWFIQKVTSPTRKYSFQCFWRHYFHLLW